MFFTYLRRELRRRMRQAIFIALGLALGVGLVITVTAASAGVKNAQGTVLHALYGVGSDVTVAKTPRVRSGGASAATAASTSASRPSETESVQPVGRPARPGRTPDHRLEGLRRVVPRGVRHRPAEHDPVGKCGTLYEVGATFELRCCGRCGEERQPPCPSSASDRWTTPGNVGAGAVRPGAGRPGRTTRTPGALRAA